MQGEANLNQLKAIKYDGDKPLFIDAGPGSGKTFVLIERIKFLLNEKHINPESMLVITFTNKAANELKDRLADDSDVGVGLINKMHIGTIHSFCFKILSMYWPFSIDVLGGYSNYVGKRSSFELVSMFLSKHMADLGFEYESFIGQKEIRTVVKKFDEYNIYGVDTPGLVDYIQNNRPINQDYLNLIEKTRQVWGDDNFIFPYNTVVGDDSFKESWYNAKYLAIAKSFPKYNALLKDKGLFDFNLLQMTALNLLEDSEILEEIVYKNVLIDEFQDSDYIQMQIFKKLIQNATSFTVVGDDDQSIYGFRGAVPEFFNDFSKKYDAEVVTLQTNYRSTQDIVDFNEQYIHDIRPKDSKKDLKAIRDKRADVYYLENNDKKEQASNLVDLIIDLKETGKIKHYNDVGILLRSRAKYDLLEEFEKRGIPLFDNERLIETDEIRSLITLLSYINGPHNPTYRNKWEEDWLNLTAFTNEKFNSSDMFKLSTETMKILSQLEKDYENQVVATENIICKKFNSRFKGKSNLDGVYKRDQEMLNEIFKHVKKPEISEMTIEDLKDLGITDENDLQFFNNLIEIKKEFYNPKDSYNRLTLLSLCYKLLNITNYIDEKFKSNEKGDKQKISNIALLTNTIYNYESIVDKYDLKGLFRYLNNNFNRYYSTPVEDEFEDAVEILTVHKAKGLEFPVVIVASLEEHRFPAKYNHERIEVDYYYGQANYYTPEKYLKYKDDNLKLEEEKHDMEEKRIVYVAMTRAKDILILSSIPHKNYKTKEEIPTPKILETMKKRTNIKKLDTNNLNSLPYTEAFEKTPIKEIIKINYSKFAVYEDCPHKYSLIYNYQFKYSDTIKVSYGLLIHDILNKIHRKYKNSQLNIKKISEIIEESFKHNPDTNIEDFHTKQNMINIIDYWIKYGSKYKIIGSEVPFNIRTENYELNGKIDLIIEKEDGTLKIVDFKNIHSKKAKIQKKEFKKQIYLYTYALKEDSYYNKYEISEGSIFAMRDLTSIDIPLNETKLKWINKQLDNAVNGILKGNFQKNTNHCQKCNLKGVICNGKN